MTSLYDAIFESILNGACQTDVINNGRASVVDDALAAMSVPELLERISYALEQAGVDLTPLSERKP